MVAFIFSLILLIAGVVTGTVLISMKKTDTYYVSEDGKVYAEKPNGKTTSIKQNVKKPLAKWSIIPYTLGAVLFIICFVVSITATVKTGHTGVQTVFGQVKEGVLDSGLHAKAPWVTVIEMDNRVQKSTVDLSCFSSDIQEVECKYTVNYQIDKQSAQEIYKTIGKEYYENVVVPNISESVKTIMAQYTAENLIGNREELAGKIEDLLSAQLLKYNIKVVSTAIEDMDFTNEFTSAVEAKQVAVQNKLKAQTEQDQKTMEAEQQAERSKIEAAANAEIARIRAEADKTVAEIGADSAEYQGRKEAAIAMQRLASINGWSVLTDENGVNELYRADGVKVTAEELEKGAKRLIEYYYIEQWNGILPETYVGNENASSIILNNNSNP